MKLGTAIKRITKVDSETLRIGLDYTDGLHGTVDLGHIFGSPKGKPLTYTAERKRYEHVGPAARR
jgi:hypothetical protein